MRFETDVPVRRDLQKSSREPTIAAAMVVETSVVREGRMWRISAGRHDLVVPHSILVSSERAN